MGRQALGASTKNIVTSVRLTKGEKEVLTERYGSPSNAFRSFVNNVMKNHEKEYVERLQRAQAGRK